VFQYDRLRPHCVSWRVPLIVPVVVVTVTFTPTEPPWLSATAIAQVPAPCSLHR